jgi:glycosyltransferase involved in cell wall biosynthesis
VRVAYYSPLPPSRSGIADYSALLLPALRERVDVVTAAPGKRAPAADVALYHVGNEPDEHGWIVDALLERPGVVVLHEYVLHHLLAGITIGRGNGRGYLDAMERELGVAGRLLGLGVLDNLLPLLWETQPERFPLSGTVLDAAGGLIVHSDYVAQRAREAGYDGRLWRIPHPAWPMSGVEPAADVAGDPLIGCFGFLNMNKRIPQLLQAFAAFRRGRPTARLLLAGGAGERFDIGRRLERLGLSEGVEQLGYLPEERMWSLMAACDVLVNLRYPTMGETSGSVIRALSLGKPLVVSDVGWFGELPDDTVLKVPVDEHEVPTIEAALGFAAEHGVALGAAARAQVEREHSLARVADA